MEYLELKKWVPRVSVVGMVAMRRKTFVCVLQLLLEEAPPQMEQALVFELEEQVEVEAVKV